MKYYHLNAVSFLMVVRTGQSFLTATKTTNSCSKRRSCRCSRLDMTTNTIPEEKMDHQTTTSTSIAIPFLPCPPILSKSNLAGNFGFDPLRLASNDEKLLRYRDAEIKHGRLAMMVAAMIFLSDLYDGSITNYLLDQSQWDEVHTMFSEFQSIPELWGFCVGLTAATDMYELARAESEGNDHIPGDIGFDPLGLYPNEKDGQYRMQLYEIQHGRVAMIAVSYLIFDEIISIMQSFMGEAQIVA